jgi:hypothetical protein
MMGTVLFVWFADPAGLLARHLRVAAGDEADEQENDGQHGEDEVVPVR